MKQNHFKTLLLKSLSSLEFRSLLQFSWINWSLWKNYSLTKSWSSIFEKKKSTRTFTQSKTMWVRIELLFNRFLSISKKNSRLKIKLLLRNGGSRLSIWKLYWERKDETRKFRGRNPRFMMIGKLKQSLFLLSFKSLDYQNSKFWN